MFSLLPEYECREERNEVSMGEILISSPLQNEPDQGRPVQPQSQRGENQQLPMSQQEGTNWLPASSNSLGLNRWIHRPVQKAGGRAKHKRIASKQAIRA